MRLAAAVVALPIGSHGSGAGRRGAEHEWLKRGVACTRAGMRFRAVMPKRKTNNER